jgi:hypothetical protein
MRWERVIKEINTIDQAIKIEDNVVRGYYNSVREAISEWILVEEDIAESYQKFNDPQMSKFAEDSKSTINTLNRILNEIDALMEARNKRIQALRELKISKVT